MIYHLPEQINLQTHLSFMHYIAMFNALLQSTQFIHHLALVFCYFTVLHIYCYIYMSILQLPAVFHCSYI